LATKEVKVPNIGGASDVEVIEIMVSPGDKVKKEDSLITLESDKASMDIPSPEDGIVESINVKLGDKVSEDSLILTLKPATETQPKQESPKAEKKAPSIKTETKAEKQIASTPSELKVRIPDIGDAKNVEVIEVLVKPGDKVTQEASLITLEGEKATMEIPSPYQGEVKNISLKVGDKVSKGDEILTLLVTSPTAVAETDQEKIEPQKQQQAEPAKPQAPTAQKPLQPESQSVHAGPGVRRLAHEFGISLQQVKGSGPKGRILVEDLQNYVKESFNKPSAAQPLSVSKAPEIDFSLFGETETVPLNKIKKLTGVHVHRSWISIPHVTQFDRADITDLEEFRKTNKEQAEKQGVKLTPLVFIMKAVVAGLKKYPNFNASLDTSLENLILKKYFNLGIAVDTPNGLVVPVVRDVDKKGMLELAHELAEISQKARKKGLTPNDLAGSCFTISSLGGIGGTAFTPIVNAPDVAILGVSKAEIAPIYKNGQFIPRLMLPLSLSYDHRVIDGADGARFLVYLSSCLSDIRTLLL
jgi:pyruvate dehydrogenase E2 component (dihydrolipoamide acetyltransferase)